MRTGEDEAAVPGRPPALWERLRSHPAVRLIQYALLVQVLGVATALPLLGVNGVVASALHHHASAPEWWAFGVSKTVGVVWAVWIMSRHAGSPSLAALGLTWNAIRSKQAFAGLAGGFALALILLVCLGVLLSITQPGGNETADAPLHPHFVAPLIFTFFIALAEEVAFRGYTFQIVERRWGTAAALTVSSVLFGLMHLQNPGALATAGIGAGLFLGTASMGFALGSGLPVDAPPLDTHWAPLGVGFRPGRPLGGRAGRPKVIVPL